LDFDRQSCFDRLLQRLTGKPFTGFYSRVFGYQSVDHYYEDSVITPGMLQSIKTPTLCLCADDDAFVPPEGE